MTDCALQLRAIAAGDSAAFWQVWDVHAPALRRLCVRFWAGRADQAEDALSTAMLRAWDQLPDHAGAIDDLAAWLRTLTRNVCIDLHRRERREIPIGGCLDARAAPAGHAESEASMRALLERIDRLPEGLRDVLRDRAIGGLSVRDIAEARCMTPAVVAERLTAARRALRTDPPDGASCQAQAAQMSVDKRMVALGLAAMQTRVIQVPTAGGGTRQMYVFVDGSTARRAVRILTLRRLVDAHPRSWRRRLELAHLLFAHGDLEGAAHEYARVIERNPLALDAYLRRAEALRMLGRNNEAAACCAEGSVRFTAEATRSHLAAMAELAHGDLDTCVAHLVQAAGADPGDLRHLRALALVLHDHGRFVEAASVFDRILEADPDDIFALVKSQDALLSTGRYQENYDRLDRALRLDPDNVQVLRMVGGRPQPDNDGVERTYKRSIALLRRAVRLSPDCSDVWDAIARLYERRHRPRAAIAVMEAFVRDHPDHSDGWSDLAEALRRNGRQAEAVLAARKAVSLAPDSPLVLGRAAWVGCQAGRADLVRDTVHALKACAPHHWGTWCVAARAHAEALNEPDEARTCLRHMHRLAPGLTSARISHAEISVALGDYRVALREAAAAYRMLAPDQVPQGAAVTRSLARAYAGLGLADQARRWNQYCVGFARRLVRWYPVGARVTLCDALMDLGMTEEARAVAREALDLWPEYDIRLKLECTVFRAG